MKQHSIESQVEYVLKAHDLSIVHTAAFTLLSKCPHIFINVALGHIVKGLLGSIFKKLLPTCRIL